MKRPREWSSPELVPNDPMLSVTSPRYYSVKKMRTLDYNSEASPGSPQTNINPFQRPSNAPSAFPPLPPVEDSTIIHNLELVDRQRPQQSQHSFSFSYPNEQTERTFSYEQVKAIVNKIVAEREAFIRAEYDQVLLERLQEQFRSFSNFNEDYISRQFKNSDFSYLS